MIEKINIKLEKLEVEYSIATIERQLEILDEALLWGMARHVALKGVRKCS